MKATSFISAVVLTAIVVLCASSCEKTLTVESSILVDACVNSDVTDSPIFTAQILNDFSHSGTRTSIATQPNEDGSYNLTWDYADEISISDGTSIAVYSSKGTGTTSTFENESGTISKSGVKYTAFYPSTLTPSNMVLPVTQEYVIDNVKNFPMHAISDNQELVFKNLCGILRLSLKNTDLDRDIKVKSISVFADGKGLSGNFTIDSQNAAVVSGSNGVVLDCKTAISLNSAIAKDFNIVVPRGNYENLKIDITTAEGSLVTLVGSSVVTVNRSGITKVSVSLKKSDFENGLEVITFTDSDVEFTER